MKPAAFRFLATAYELSPLFISKDIPFPEELFVSLTGSGVGSGVASGVGFGVGSASSSEGDDTGMVMDRCGNRMKQSYFSNWRRKKYCLWKNFLRCFKYGLFFLMTRNGIAGVAVSFCVVFIGKSVMQGVSS